MTAGVLCPIRRPDLKNRSATSRGYRRVRRPAHSYGLHFPGLSRLRQTTAITQDSFSWSLSLSELLLRHSQDPAGPGVLNKRHEPQPISRSLLDGKRYLFHEG